jgi:hypothetical protein
MSFRRTSILLVLAAALALTGSASSASDATSAAAPTGLRGFLLRVDEPRATTFPRTPSFGWSPVAGAVRYEFQLSTSNAFRDSGIVYSDTSLTSPVAAPALTLPWITGSPHALYARVRAILPDETTDWSAAFGFDMEPSLIPSPLPSYPGLLRWTPVDGAVGYQVWFVDIPKLISTTTNVADEREFYSFHQAASWLGQVRWRVRALRHDFNSRANGLPAAGHGAWSPVYTSVNPPFAVGAMAPAATVSDVVATGAANAPAHRLTPGFAFGGNRSLAGAASELYRVHVFTDRKCINRVYTGSVVGSPAYAPRSSGPLQLPRATADIASARSRYLPDGSEGQIVSADFSNELGNESLPPVAFTTGLPAGKADAPAGGASAPATPETPPAAGAAPAAPAAASAEAGKVELLKVTGSAGPPISLWDTDWSRGGGYYWTVLPVDAGVAGAASTSVAGAGSAIGATTLPVGNGGDFRVGDAIAIGSGGNLEAATVVSTTSSSITVGTALKNAHGAGEPVVRTTGITQYREAELAQDACAAGRVLRFGKESEPSLTAAGDLYASGLSPTGKLESGDDAPSFYRAPLVAWTAALGADAYAVQWSRKLRPFTPEADPATTALGMLTLNTSAVLPLEPGTWHYRVRGYDFSLPTGAQALSWSQPERLVVTRPVFAVVSGGTSPATTQRKTLRVPAAGFSVEVPSSWKTVAAKRTTSGAGPRPLGASGSRLRLAARGSGAGLFVQTKADGGTQSQSAWAAKARKLPGARCAAASLPAGTGLRCTVAGSTLYLLRHRNATYTLTVAGVGRPAAARIARSFRFSS